jgi:hypothetical protein
MTTAPFAGVPAAAMPAPPPTWIIRAVLGLRGMLLKVVSAITPPELQVLERSTGIAFTMATAVFARHYVPVLDAGPASAGEIARKLNRDPDATFRFLHLMASIGFVTMRADRAFSHNRVSRVLSRDHHSRAGSFVEYFASGSNVRSWLDLDATLVTGKNAFERVHGMSVWDWFDAHPEERDCFAEAMMGLTLGDAPFVAAGYPFVEVKTICDVGGGRGTLASELLLRHAHLRATVVDNAGVLELARSLLQQRGVAERATLTPGNFFEAVPAGADLYTLKNILHDWDDERALAILRTVRRAMQPGQRVLIIEAFIDRSKPDPLVTPPDMQMMMVCCEGRERTEADFRRLLEQSGFTAGRSFPHPVVGMVEGIA